MPERLAHDGGVLLSVKTVQSEPVSGPEKPGEIFFYYLEGVGFRLKSFGVDAVDALRAQGALPGVWTLLDSDTEPISAGETKTLASVAGPGPGEILMILASGDVNGVHVHSGNTAAAPANASIVYDQVTNGGNTDIKARAGSAASAVNLQWAVYKVVLPS